MPMKRAQAILLIFTLFAAPFALLARATFGMGSDCGNLCCLPHRSHTGHMHDARSQSKAEGMACHHQDGSEAAFCAMKAGHRPMDFGFFAPLAPTTPSASANLALPRLARSAIAQSSASFFLGFPFAPFQPPRS